MNVDNTMLLISKTKYIFENYIEKRLNDYGYFGIVPSHGEIIIKLKSSPKLKMGELATLINKDPSTVTTLVKKLCKQEFVIISKDEKDKRATVAELTKKGIDLFNIIIEISEEMYIKTYSNISDSEKDAFRNTLAKIANNFLN